MAGEASDLSNSFEIISGIEPQVEEISELAICRRCKKTKLLLNVSNIVRPFRELFVWGDPNLQISFPFYCPHCSNEQYKLPPRSPPLDELGAGCVAGAGLKSITGGATASPPVATPAG